MSVPTVRVCFLIRESRIRQLINPARAQIDVTAVGFQHLIRNGSVFTISDWAL